LATGFFPRDEREAAAERSCSNKKLERDDDSKKSHPAPGAPQLAAVAAWLIPGLVSVPTVMRLSVFGFLVGQQLQQPIVLNLISRRITFRLGYQPSIVRKILVVDVAFHCDLRVDKLTWREWFQSKHDNCTFF
jgi:hypothetical protein